MLNLLEKEMSLIIERDDSSTVYACAGALDDGDLFEFVSDAPDSAGVHMMVDASNVLAGGSLFCVHMESGIVDRVDQAQSIRKVVGKLTWSYKS
jgi:hypothetical protein